MKTLEIITTDHNDFQLFIAILGKFTERLGCTHGYSNYAITCNEFEKITGIAVDKEKTLDYFKSNGGYCDCEILMNVPF